MGTTVRNNSRRLQSQSPQASISASARARGAGPCLDPARVVRAIRTRKPARACRLDQVKDAVTDREDGRERPYCDAWRGLAIGEGALRTIGGRGLSVVDGHYGFLLRSTPRKGRGWLGGVPHRATRWHGQACLAGLLDCVVLIGGVTPASVSPRRATRGPERRSRPGISRPRTVLAPPGSTVETIPRGEVEPPDRVHGEHRPEGTVDQRRSRASTPAAVSRGTARRSASAPTRGRPEAAYSIQVAGRLVTCEEGRCGFGCGSGRHVCHRPVPGEHPRGRQRCIPALLRGGGPEPRGVLLPGHCRRSVVGVIPAGVR